jgi:glycosyltransferase involved in cell wall biosynthesis
MPSVSAIILTRDSQRTIEACIQAIKPAIDHVIIVDTGSTDDTVQIAKANGAYVYHFEWCDDFAAARNFGDSCATTDWVIHVDSDEILREEDADKIRKICAQYRRTSHPVKIILQQINILSERVGVETAARMFKRGALIWRGIIHEQLYCRRGEFVQSIQSDIGVIHDGYNPHAIDLNKKICTRNIRLLQKGIEQEPNNATYHFFLGRDYMSIHEYEAAIPHFKCAVDLYEQNDILLGDFDDAHKHLFGCLLKVEDYSGAERIANLMVSKFPDKYTEGWFNAPTPS